MDEVTRLDGATQLDNATVSNDATSSASATVLGDATVLDGASNLTDEAVGGDSVETSSETSSTPTPIVVSKGELLLNTYRIESDAIKGGMGSVWRVHHGGWNLDLAMKRPHAELFQNEQQKASFAHECEVWVNLGLHPQIVSCYYIRDIGGVPSIFSEWMDGGSLKTWIADKRLYEEDALSTTKRILDIAIQFAWGLNYSHEQKLIHQDVKPENLLLTKEGDAKVADFGIAQARQALRTSSETSGATADTPPEATIISAAGAYTPAYCSPEQASGQTLSRHTDIYSWAVSVLEMYLGERYWQHGVTAGAALEDYLAMDMKASMPEALKDLLRSSLHSDATKRPSNFSEISNRLIDLYTQTTGEAYPRTKSRAAADTADSLNNRALSFLDLGKRDEATALWKRALTVDPLHLDATYNLHLSEWRNSRSDDLTLLTHIKSAQAEDPDKAAYLSEQITKERNNAQALCIYGNAEHPVSLSAAAPDGTSILIYSPHLNEFTRYHAETGEKRGISLDNPYSEEHGKPLEIQLTATGFWTLYDKLLLYRDLFTGEVKNAFYPDGESILSFGVDEQNKYLVTLSWQGRELNAAAIPTVIAWERETSRKLFARKIDVRGKPCLSPDGRYFIARSATLFVLEKRNIADGEKLADFVGNRARILSFATNSTRSHVAAIDEQGYVFLWSLSTNKGHLLGKLAHKPSGKEQLAFLQGSQYVLIANQSEENLIRFFDTSNNRVVRTLTPADINWNGDAAPSALKGGIFLLEKQGQSAEVWAIQPSQFRAEFSVSKILKTELRMVQEQAFRAHMDEAEQRFEQGQINEALASLEAARTIPGFENDAECLVLRDKLLPYCAVVSLRTAALEDSFKGHTAPVSFISLSSDGALALSSSGRSGDKCPLLWSPDTGKLITPLAQDTPGCVAGAFCAHGAVFFLGDHQSLVRAEVTTKMKKMFDGTVRERYACDKIETYEAGITFSQVNTFPETRRVVSVHKTPISLTPHLLKVWDLGGDSTVRDLESSDTARDISFGNTDGGIACAAFTADGKTGFLSLGKQHKVVAVDLDTGAVQNFIDVPATVMAVSPDNSSLAVADAQGSVRVFSLEGGLGNRQELASFAAERELSALAFLHSGKFLICAGEDGVASIFDSEGTLIIQTAKGQSSSITALAVGPHDFYILLAGADGKMLRWNLDWNYQARGHV